MKNTFESRCGMGRRQYETETKKPLYKYVNETDPAAVLTLSNCFGVGLFDVSGDECIAAWHNGESYTGAHRHCIHYSTAGRPYIKKGPWRLYIDQFIAA